MAKAVWNGKVLAESETYETVEGNVYFPEGAVKREYLLAELDDLDVSVEGPGAILQPAGGRAGESGRSLVLSESQPSGSEHQEPYCVLARGGSGEIGASG